MKKKRVISVFLAVLTCLLITGCGSSEPKKPTVEESYNALVTYATEGKYIEGWRVYQGTPELAEYEDAKVYNEYCVAMRAYEAGGIGYAYDSLLNIEPVLDTEATIAAIETEIGGLNGIYKADNGAGSYLYLIIENGKVGTELIGYYDDQELTYEESDLYSDIVKVTFTDGSQSLAVGRYSTIGAEVEANYIMYPDAEGCMLIKYESYEYDTFAGVYTKISE